MTTTITIPARPRLVPAADLELKVRSVDHDTSWMAAARMKPAEERALKDTLHRILTFDGPMTHDELVEAYMAEGGTVTPQRVRTACAEMTRSRNLRTGRPQKVRVRPTGVNGLSVRDHASQLWDAVNDDERTYEALDHRGNVLFEFTARDFDVATYRAARRLEATGVGHVGLRERHPEMTEVRA